MDDLFIEEKCLWTLTRLARITCWCLCDIVTCLFNCQSTTIANNYLGLFVRHFCFEFPLSLSELWGFKHKGKIGTGEFFFLIQISTTQFYLRQWQLHGIEAKPWSSKRGIYASKSFLPAILRTFCWNDRMLFSASWVVIHT